jgi:hypothetical protein
MSASDMLVYGVGGTTLLVLVPVVAGCMRRSRYVGATATRKENLNDTHSQQI